MFARSYICALSSWLFDSNGLKVVFCFRSYEISVIFQAVIEILLLVMINRGGRNCCGRWMGWLVGWITFFVADARELYVLKQKLINGR